MKDSTSDSFILVDTGVMSRYFLGKPQITQLLTKSEFDQLRYQLDKYIKLNHNDCIDLAVAACRLYPDTGLGDCFTIGVGLFFDVPIFTLNQKHVERIPGMRLYTPDNYAVLERD